MFYTLILLFTLIPGSIYKTWNQRTLQPYGPKMCEELCQNPQECSDHVFDEVQLKCRLVTKAPSSMHKSSQAKYDHHATTSKEGKKSSQKGIAGPCLDEDFIEACDYGTVDKVQKRVLQGLVDINCRHFSGMTCVMIAAQENYTEIFDFLVQHKCDLLAADDDNKTVLHYACICNSMYIARQLVDDDTIDVNWRDTFMKTPLMYVESMPLMELLKKRGADFKAVDEDENNILHLACGAGNAEMVNFILSNDILDINCRGQYGQTPVMFAVSDGHLPLVKVLKAFGADMKSVNAYNNSLLHEACAHAGLPMVRYIMSLGIIDMERKGEYGRTPMMVAVRNVNLEVADMLKNKRADITTVDKDGNNILHLACKSSVLKCLTYVMSLNRFDVDCRGEHGRTALMLAAEHQNKDFVYVLVQRYRANIKTLDDDGNNVLHIACQTGGIFMVKYLAKWKIFSSYCRMRDKNGDTPIQLARKYEHDDIVTFFKSRGY